MAFTLVYFLTFLVLFVQSFCLVHVHPKPLPPPPFYITPTTFRKYLELDNLALELPAIYVFGDSFLDAGNNNFLETIVKANFLPYGIDFGGVPTGRVTNGRTVVDFIAQVAALPFPPPILQLSESQRRSTFTGVNYGSSSAGIQPLPPTAKNIFGHILSFDEQIELFKNTTTSLKGQLSSFESFAIYMSKSLFFIHIGSNDLGIFWELDQHNNFNNGKDYAVFLLDELPRRLEAIYQLGARKFLVNNVSPLGCQPFNLNTKKHNHSCVEDINQRIAFFNGLLPNLLTKLEMSLKGSTFVLCDLYRVFEDVYTQPATYGFTNVNGSCCIDEAGNGTRGCAKGSIPCVDRTSHVFFDPFHPSENAHFLWFRRLLKDETVCSPLNLLQLMQVK